MRGHCEKNVSYLPPSMCVSVVGQKREERGFSFNSYKRRKTLSRIFSLAVPRVPGTHKASQLCPQLRTHGPHMLQSQICRAKVLSLKDVQARGQSTIKLA